MDWNAVQKSSTHRDDPAPMKMIESCWRMRGPRGRVIACGIYHTPGIPGFEVRCGYGANDLLRSERRKDLAKVREIANHWRDVLASGGFTELAGREGE